MIQFTELKITNDAKHLRIRVTVPNDTYHENIYIKNIAIDTLCTYSSIGPSDRAVYHYETGEDNYKTLELDLNIADLIVDMKDNLFIVYVSSKGEYPFDVPCGVDNVTSIGVVYNECFLKDMMLQEMKSLVKDCEIPKTMIDTFMHIKAFKIALETKHITRAVEWFKKFFKNGDGSLGINGKPFEVKHCNCGKV